MIRADHVSWEADEKVKTQIDLIDCSKAFLDLEYESEIARDSHAQFQKGIESLRRKTKSSYLCPHNLDSLIVAGNFASDHF